jgi:hypothetical protein
MEDVIHTQQATIFDAFSHNQYRLSAILNWAISSLIQKPATALMCCDKNNISSCFAIESGFDVMQFASAAAVKQSGFWLWEQNNFLGYETVFLNNSYLDSVLAPRVEAGFEQLGMAAKKIRQVPVDDFLGGIKQVSWIHCSYAEVLLILKGAKARISSDKPVLTFSANALNANIAALQDICSELDYCLYNSRLEPVSRAVSHLSSGTLMFALPVGSPLYPKLVSLLGFEQACKAVIGSKHAPELIKRYYLTLLGNQSKGSELLRRYLFSDNQIVLLKNLCNKDIYPREGSDEHFWHWTGPNNDALIQLCIPAPGQYFFRIHTGDLPFGHEQNRAAVFINGRAVFFGDINDLHIFEFAYDFASLDFSEHAWMTISVANMREVEGKKMGVAIQKIEMYVPGDELL